MEEKILIDQNTLKALTVDTRMNILKLLSEKKQTLSDIAQLLSLGVSTVKEHLDILERADLVKREETDRKWKYYSLTTKGRRLIEPREVKVLFAFIVSLVATLGAGALMLKQFFGASLSNAGTFAAQAMPQAALKAGAAAPAPTAVAAEGARNAAALAQDVAYAAAPQIQVSYSINWMLFAFIPLLTLTAFLFGFYLKRRVIIVNVKDKPKNES